MLRCRRKTSARTADGNGQLVDRRGTALQEPEKLKALFGERANLSYAAADVEDPAALKEALRNSRGVIFAASGKGYWSPAKVDNQARHLSKLAACPALSPGVHGTRLKALGLLMTIQTARAGCCECGGGRQADWVTAGGAHLELLSHHKASLEPYEGLAKQCKARRDGAGP